MNMIFDARIKFFMREHDERAWMAWNIAYLPRKKRPPPLSQLLSKRKRERQTPEEQLEIARQWHALFKHKGAKARAN